MIDLGIAILLLLAAAGTGRLILDRLAPAGLGTGAQVLFSAGLGLGALQLGLLALGLSATLYRPAIWALTALWGGVGLISACRWLPGLAPLIRARVAGMKWYHGVAVGLGGLVLSMGAVRALAPPHGMPDPLAYQMALPKLYLLKHALSFEPTITGALYPCSMNLLYVLAHALRDGSLAQVLHWSMALLTCGAIAALASGLGSARAGVWGAVVFCLTPAVVYFSPMGYIDVGLCFFQLLALWALLEWLDNESAPHLVLAAVLGGLALGVKHHSLAVVALGVVIVIWVSWRRHGPRAALARGAVYGGIGLCFVLPWYARSWYYSGSPIWPLANDLLGGVPYGRAALGVPGFAQDALAQGAGAGERVGAFVGGAVGRLFHRSTALWDWTWNPRGWQYAVGAYYLALLPGVALLSGRRIWRLVGLCAALYALAVLVLHANPRYALVLFALLAVLAGLVVDRLLDRAQKWVRLGVAAVMLLSIATSAAWSYWLARPVFGVATGAVAAPQFLRSSESTYPMFEFCNTHLPRSAKVLLQGIVKGYYCDRDYMWDHPFQRQLVYADCATAEDLAARLHELGITHVARMGRVPGSRVRLGYPQYFEDPFHEGFRRRYLKLVYRDRQFVVFALREPAAGAG